MPMSTDIGVTYLYNLLYEYIKLYIGNIPEHFDLIQVTTTLQVLQDYK